MIGHSEKKESAYAAVMEVISLYWKIYGGIEALYKSPFLHVALVIALISSFAKNNDISSSITWYELNISVLPGMLGFTLAAYVALVTFGGKGFLSALAGDFDDELPSPFMEISASFLHFIIIQVVCLLFTIVCAYAGLENSWVAFVGLLLFFYAILTGLAAAFTVFNMTDIFDTLTRKNDSQEGSESD